MNKYETKIIEFPKIYDSRGNLSVIENMKQMPFKISDTRWIFGIPAGGEIEGYTTHNQDELIIALSGSFDIVTKTETSERYYHLDRAYIGLYIPTNVWHCIKNFSTNAIALVISSHSEGTQKTHQNIAL